MWAHRALTWGLLAALTVALAVPAGATAGGGAVAHPFAAQDTATATEDGVTRLQLDIQLTRSGDARWTVTTYVPLDGPAETEAFRELGREYANGTAEVDVDVALFRRYAAAARSASGREMVIPGGSVEREWAIENDTGVLRLRFTWTNFARTDGEQFVVDDAFRTDSGTWLPRLERGQELVVHPPEEGRFLETPKRVTDAKLRWEGPRSFGTDYFYIVYRASEAGTTPRTSPGTSPATPPDGPFGEVSAGAMLLFAVLVGGGGVALLWLRRGHGDEGAPGPPPGESPTGGTAGAENGDAGADAGGTATTDEPDEPTPEAPFAGVDVEMLSDEERVLRLLEANGGRMKQARIVKETDWSNAKVSQLLSEMAEGGEIDKLRVGRENLISLPDVDVDTFEE